VPVGPQERERATEDNQRFAGAGGARKRRQSEDAEFKLIDSEETPQAAPAAAAAAPPAAARPAAAAPSERESAGKVGARERRTPQTLEETLEILGANELAIDNVRTDSVSDTGVRHLRVQVQKNTPFSRLLERLSERVRKS
jgi:type II secretory pathway component HofQ